MDLRVLQRRQLAQHHLGIADVEAGAGERGADAQHAIEADLQQVLQRRSGALDVRIDPRPRLLEALQRVGNALGARDGLLQGQRHAHRRNDLVAGARRVGEDLQHRAVELARHQRRRQARVAQRRGVGFDQRHGYREFAQ